MLHATIKCGSGDGSVSDDDAHDHDGGDLCDRVGKNGVSFELVSWWL